LEATSLAYAETSFLFWHEQCLAGEAASGAQGGGQRSEAGQAGRKGALEDEAAGRQAKAREAEGRQAMTNMHTHTWT